MLIDEADKRAALQFASRRPMQGPKTGFAGAFAAELDNAFSVDNSNAEDAIRGEAIADFRRRFFEASGQRLEPFSTGAGPEERGILPTPADFFTRRLNQSNTDKVRAQFDAWKAQNPDSDMEFPTEESLRDYAAQQGSATKSENDDVLSRVDGFGGAVGQILGGMVGGTLDPSVLPTLMFGAGAASGIVRTAIAEAGIGFASEAAVQAQTFDFRKAVNPDRTVGDAATEVAFAAAGGAAFGGGIKALSKAWQAFRNTEGVAQPSRETADAGNVVISEAAKPDNKFQKTPEGEVAFKQSLNKAIEDVTAGRPVELPEAAQAQSTARTGRVFDVDGRSVDVEYQVVEAADLVTSNNDDLSVNEAFPGDLQPRDRGRAVSQEQIQNIASRLEPERLGVSAQSDSGAPIIGPDNVVESGNGRTLAIRKAYAMDGEQAGAYTNYLKSQGFDLSGMNNPVLVARRISDLTPEDRVQFTTASNRSTALRLGTAEQASADARLIDDAVLSRFEGGDISDAANRDFTKGFMAKLARSEQGDMLDASGSLSANGIRRVKAALLARAYNRPALLERALEDADSNIKTIAGALEDAAPFWARMRDAVTRGEIPRGMDISDDLTEVIDTIIRARAEGTKIADAFEQAEMFGGPSEIAKAIARAMFNTNMTRHVARGKISDLLKDYADEAGKNLDGARLFGEPLEAGDIVQGALERAGREDVAGLMRERLDDDAVAEIAGSRETEDAVMLEGERLRAEHGSETIEIDVEGPDGELVTVQRSLADIMDEADDEIEEAGKLEACAAGRADTAA